MAKTTSAQTDTIKGQLPNGIAFELREPTLDDLAAIESIAIQKGLSAHELGTIETSLLMFSRICERYGDSASVTRDELGKLPTKALKGVLTAMESFRDDD